MSIDPKTLQINNLLSSIIWTAARLQENVYRLPAEYTQSLIAIDRDINDILDLVEEQHSVEK